MTKLVWEEAKPPSPKCINHPQTPATRVIMIEGGVEAEVCTPCAHKIMGGFWVCKYCFVRILDNIRFDPMNEPHKPSCPRVISEDEWLWALNYNIILDEMIKALLISRRNREAGNPYSPQTANWYRWEQGFKEFNQIIGLLNA